jgi:hypothetical protein
MVAMSSLTRSFSPLKMARCGGRVLRLLRRRFGGGNGLRSRRIGHAQSLAQGERADLRASRPAARHICTYYRLKRFAAAFLHWCIPAFLRWRVLIPAGKL